MKRAREQKKKKLKVNKKTNFRDFLPGLSGTWFLSPATSQRVHHTTVITLDSPNQFFSYILTRDSFKQW